MSDHLESLRIKLFRTYYPNLYEKVGDENFWKHFNELYKQLPNTGKVIPDRTKRETKPLVKQLSLDL